MWQTLERKAAFIAQVTRGDLPDRDVDDIGDQALSFAEVKALATGDPLVLEKAAVDADVARLARLQRAHHDDQQRLRRTLDSATRRAEAAEHRAVDLEAVIGRLTDTRGEQFTMTIDGQIHTKRVDSGEHLQRLLQQQLDQTPPETSGPSTQSGALGGLGVCAQGITTLENEVRVTIPDAHIEVRFLANDLNRRDPANLITRLEHHLHHLPDTLAGLNEEVAGARAEADRATVRIGAPWDRAQELAELRRRQQEIDEQLAATTEPAQEPRRTGTPPEPGERPAPSAQSPGEQAMDRTTSRLDALQARARTYAPPPGLGP